MRRCSVEGCWNHGQFRFCGIWICYDHTLVIDITHKPGTAHWTEAADFRQRQTEVAPEHAGGNA